MNNYDKRRKGEFAELSSLANLSLRRKPISNVGNLIRRFYRRNCLLWKMGVSGLISNSELAREWAIERERSE